MVRRLTVCEREAIRRRRGQGEKLEPLAAEFHVAPKTIWKHCRGVRLPPRRSEEPRVLAVLALVGLELGAPDWLADSHRRGRPRNDVRAARRAAALALRQLGLDEVEIGRLIFQGWSAQVFPLLSQAEVDPCANRAAAAVLSRLGERRAA